jgi:membrane fusion protein (multidrug efflux system)
MQNVSPSPSRLQQARIAFSEAWKAAPRLRKRQFIGVSALLLIIILSFIIHHYQTHISTDNAYVNANNIQIATQVSGPVLHLHVKNNQTVRKGDLLFEIDPEPFQLAIEEATAQVLQTKAQLKNATINATRIQDLVSHKYLSPEDLDNALTAVDVAAANLKLAEAKLAESKLQLSYTKIAAETNGIINNLSLRPGTAVQAQIPLFVLISSEEYWVDTNFKETELTNIQPKQSAKIVLDMYPNYVFNGVVDSISSSSGTAFSLLPPQNATGNWVKVTQRIPVKILITNPHPAYPLRIGATATVTVHTK